jgi:hypothetical protein
VGKICKICDAKFILRSSYLPQKKKLEKYNEKLALAQKDDSKLTEMLDVRAQQLDKYHSGLIKKQTALKELLREEDPTLAFQSEIDKLKLENQQLLLKV